VEFGHEHPVIVLTLDLASRAETERTGRHVGESLDHGANSMAGATITIDAALSDQLVEAR
jgi:hypothetical protein